MSYNDAMKTLGTGLVVLCMLLSSPPAASGMTALGDGDLAACSAGSGVSLGVSGTALINVGSIWLQDTDYDILLDPLGYKNRIEFQNIVSSYSISTLSGNPITIDVGSNSAGRTYVDIQDPSPITFAFSANLHFLKYSSGAYSYDPLYLVGPPGYDPVLDSRNYITDYIVHDLGTIEVSDIVSTENNLLIGAHGGVDFYYQAKIDIGSSSGTGTGFHYNYNATNALEFNGIHIADSATGDPRYPLGHTNTGPLDPDPTTPPWTFSGPFKIGNADGPAQLDIGTSTSPVVTTLLLNLPMEGSIRVEDVIFGTDSGNNPVHFGPLALDGINVHHLAIQINPNP